MATDLTKVNDHPSTILLSASIKALTDERPEYADHYTAAAGKLIMHELKHGVTFAALDNDALAEVQRIYSEMGTDIHTVSVLDFLSAVSDLLGLAD